MEQHSTQLQGATQEIRHNAPLSSSELASLWRTNIYYSMLICIYKHFLNTFDDPDLRPFVEDGLSICKTRANKTFDILKMEGQPTPKGFGNEDMDQEHQGCSQTYSIIIMSLIWHGSACCKVVLTCPTQPVRMSGTSILNLLRQQ